MPSSELDLLRFNLQERQYPYFEDNELEMLLQQYGDVKIATYYGCLLKAKNNKIKVGPIQIESNQQYWLNLAEQFKPRNSSSSGYKTSMSRVDGQ